MHTQNCVWCEGTGKAKLCPGCGELFDQCVGSSSNCVNVLQNWNSAGVQGLCPSCGGSGVLRTVNLTPHPVIILRDDTQGAIAGVTGTGPSAKEGKFSLVAEIAPEGKVARAVQKDDSVGWVVVNGVNVPLIRSAFGAPTDLPDQTTGTNYIVSVVTAQAAKAAGRQTSDLLVTADVIRDQAGKIIGCRRFSVI